MLLEFQKRVLFLLTDIKDILQKVCRKYETPDSDFHIEVADTLDDLKKMMENIKGSEKQLVSLASQ